MGKNITLRGKHVHDGSFVWRILAQAVLVAVSNLAVNL